MSHQIAVVDNDKLGGRVRAMFRKAPPSRLDVLSRLPGLIWSEARARAQLAEGGEVLIARDGAARGVSLRVDEVGMFVRIFTASSAADLDLAIEIVSAMLEARGDLAVNEDGEPLNDLAAVRRRYDAEFRRAYLEWGPLAIVEAVQDGGSAELGGPWANATLSTEDLERLREAHATPAELSAAILARLVDTQRAARAVHDDLAAGRVPTAPDAIVAAAVESWLESDPEPAAIATALGTVSGAVLDNCRLLTVALVHGPALRAAGASALVRDLRTRAVRAATATPSFANELAARALALAQDEEFPIALELFDVIVLLPALDTDAIDVSSGSVEVDEDERANEHVNAQSSWLCNATWAAQVDNNHLPLDTDRARLYIERALPFAPGNPAIFFNLACLAVEIEDHAGALRYISAAKQHGFARMADIAATAMLAPLRSSPDWSRALAGELSLS